MLHSYQTALWVAFNYSKLDVEWVSGVTWYPDVQCEIVFVCGFVSFFYCRLNKCGFQESLLQYRWNLQLTSFYLPDLIKYEYTVRKQSRGFFNYFSHKLYKVQSLWKQYWHHGAIIFTSQNDTINTSVQYIDEQIYHCWEVCLTLLRN